MTACKILFVCLYKCISLSLFIWYIINVWQTRCKANGGGAQGRLGDQWIPKQRTIIMYANLSDCNFTLKINSVFLVEKLELRLVHRCLIVRAWSQQLFFSKYIYRYDIVRGSNNKIRGSTKNKKRCNIRFHTVFVLQQCNIYFNV